MLFEIDNQHNIKLPGPEKKNHTLPPYDIFIIEQEL